MAERVERSTVDLSGYPDLVVIYLGMRVRKWKGLKTIFGFGPKISNSVARRPPGLQKTAAPETVELRSILSPRRPENPPLRKVQGWGAHKSRRCHAA